MSIKFLSFLGTNNYEPTIYKYKGNGYVNDEVQYFVQISIYDIIKNIVKNDTEHRFDKSNIETFLFLTKEAENINYLGKEADKIKYKPLCFYKEKMNIKTVRIDMGLTEDEIWSNFNTIYDVLEEGDSVFVDVTNSLRSIPLLLMALLNFAKISKNIKVCGIFYGAFNKTEETDILSLTSIDTIETWTNNVDKLLSNGGSKKFCNDIKQLINKIKKACDNKILSKFNKDLSLLQRNIDLFFSAVHTCDIKLLCKQLTN